MTAGSRMGPAGPIRHESKEPEVAANWLNWLLMGGVLLGLVTQVGIAVAPVRVVVHWKARIAGKGYVAARARLTYLFLRVDLRASLCGSILRSSIRGAWGFRPPALDLKGRLRVAPGVGPLAVASRRFESNVRLAWPRARRPRGRASSISPAGPAGTPTRARPWLHRAAMAFVGRLKGRVFVPRARAALRVGAPDAMSAAVAAGAAHAAAYQVAGRMLRLVAPRSPMPAITVRPAFGHPVHLAARGELSFRVAALWVCLAAIRAAGAVVGAALRGSAGPADVQRARAHRAAA